MRALVIANRHSRAAREDVLDQAVSVLERDGVAVERRLPESVDELDEVIRGEGPGVDVIVLAGGDGTLNAAAEALHETGKPVAILPSGTGNDLARTLGLPLEPVEAAGLVMHGRRKRIDLGRANGKLFFNVAHVGLGAEVIRHHTKDRKRRLWIFAYVLSVRDAYQEVRAFTVDLTCDGNARTFRTIQVAVGNGRHYGGGMTIHEDARIDDQQLEVFAIPPMPFWRLLTQFPSLRRGRYEEIDVIHGREVEVRTRRPRAVSTDGEITTETPVTFRLVPEALEVIVPPSTG